MNNNISTFDFFAGLALHAELTARIQCYYNGVDRADYQIENLICSALSTAWDMAKEANEAQESLRLTDRSISELRSIVGAIDYEINQYEKPLREAKKFNEEAPVLPESEAIVLQKLHAQRELIRQAIRDKIDFLYKDL